MFFGQPTHRSTKGHLHLGATLIAGLVLAACVEREIGASKLTNYVERLGTAANSNVQDIERSLRVELPADLDTQLVTPTGSLSLIDFLSLSGCEVQANIAKRNTSMGRAASASQRLILDLEFLRLAPNCITLMQEKGEITVADTLRENVDLRRINLPARVFSAILDGPEWHKFWNQPLMLGPYPQSASGDSAQALWELSERVQRFIAHNWTVADEDLEPLLAAIRVNSGGQLLAAAALQSDYLDQANQLLRDAHSKGIYCKNDTVTEAGTITRTVVTKYFTGDVQRWSAQVSQRHYEIQSALHGLETDLLPMLPQPYLTWIAERDALLHRLYAAPREHVSVIKETVNAC